MNGYEPLESPSLMILALLTSFLTLAFVKATMTSKGQITIPLQIRRKLKLHAGTVLDFDEEADHLRASKCFDRARMRRALGLAKTELAGRSVLEWLEELRGPVRPVPGKPRR